MVRRLTELCLLACSLTSCVKENRMECPCLLDITVHGGEESIVTVSLWDGGLRQSEQFNTLGGKDRQECLISRGSFILTASSGMKHDLSESGELVIPPGEQMDELYGFACSFTASGDDASQEVTLHKQFAVLNINLVISDAGTPAPEIEIKGNVKGVDIISLSPLPGEYSTLLKPLMGRRYRTVLPRQTDSSLALVADGFDIPLGEYIVKSGYNWEDIDLKDIDIDVDLVKLKVSVSIQGWADGETFEIVI